MSAVVVVGAQWGDEGKGKVVDLYAPVRRAGRTVRGRRQRGAHARRRRREADPASHPLRHPSRADQVRRRTRHRHRPGGLPQGDRGARGARRHDQGSALLVSQRAHVVLPHHKLIDGLREQKSGGDIGTTKRGIGPCYEDKVARRGVRMGDLLDADPPEEQARSQSRMLADRSRLTSAVSSRALDEITAEQYVALGASLAAYIGDVAARSFGARFEANEKILLEGAQGTMLDIDNGTYPVRDELERRRRRRMRGRRHRSDTDRKRHRHRQGLHHPRRRRARSRPSSRTTRASSFVTRAQSTARPPGALAAAVGSTSSRSDMRWRSTA